ncbi:MAG TPA: response regulator [Polyangiaceae bacterium]|jgi:CheY-like chemotaxis protein|nr:response regulator [Polyangiaceae bacterium]
MASRLAADTGSALDARRVLVIDDDEDFADGVAAVLDDAGFEVRVGYSASEGLGLLDSFVPDVAIVDIRMPVVDGHALLAIFRAEPRLRSCTFVGISGHASDDVEENHFDHFFRKPFDTDQVLSALMPKH